MFHFATNILCFSIPTKFFNYFFTDNQKQSTQHQKNYDTAVNYFEIY